MPRELNLFGIYVPTLLAVLVATIPVYWLLDVLLAKTGVYRWVWHVDLFRLAIFVILFGAVGNGLYR